MNWRRKCWEKCGGSGTEKGREEGGRERISFYAFKAVLSTKTTQNGLVKYCAEEGRREKQNVAFIGDVRDYAPTGTC